MLISDFRNARLRTARSTVLVVSSIAGDWGTATSCRGTRSFARTLHGLSARLRQQPAAGDLARCYSGRLPVVSSYTPHFGEEPPLTGTRGAGNIFFGNCNLRCVYCQNYQISQAHKEQIKNEVTHERLAEMMLELQARGCHNINFVSPTHFAPQMARAILIAAEQWPAPADRLQHERVRFSRSAETAGWNRRCLSARFEICRG